MSATFILDGSNLAWLGPGEGAALAPVDAIADALRAEWPGCKVITVCDASLRHRLDAADKAEHQRRTKAGELVEAPADEDADAYILDAARRLEGCVVTRDLYRDRREGRAGIPMLRPALIGGAVILGDPKVFAHAESDRGEPVDAAGWGPRVPAAPLPGGDPLAAAPASDPPAVAAPEAAPPPDASETSDDGEPDDPPPEAPVPTPKPRAKPPSKPRRPSKASSASTRSKSTTPAKRSGGDEPPDASPPGMPRGLILLVVLIALGGAVWRLAGDGQPSGERPPGVLFVRNCKAWQLGGDVERIVYHAPAGHCATSVAAAGPGRLLVTVVEGSGPRTTGAVQLVETDGSRALSSAEITRGRPGAGAVEGERAGARIVGVDPIARQIALRVSPAEERPPIWVVRSFDGHVIGHTEEAVGVALGVGQAAVLRHHCPAGCGTVHVGGDFASAVAAAEIAPPPSGPAPRWAGPAAFSPDGRHLAAAEAFDGERGGVRIFDAAGRDARRVEFIARSKGLVNGLAWTREGLYLGASDALYVTSPDGDGVWQPVSNKAGAVAPAAADPPRE